MEEKPEAKQEKKGKTEDHIGYFSYRIRKPASIFDANRKPNAKRQKSDNPQ